MILKINDRIRIREVNLFNNFSLNLKYDSVGSTFSFSFYFNPDNKEHSELACVSHFHEAIVEHNGETILTGYILTQTFQDSAKKELSNIGGYSKAGVLEDCDIPTSLYPLQADGLTLKEITERIISKFGIKLVIDANVSASARAVFSNTEPTTDAGKITSRDPETTTTTGGGLNANLDKKITKANAKENQNIKAFLTQLAAQRNIIISHNEHGNLLFTEIKTNLKPILDFSDGVIGTTMSMSFNGQAIHSHITVVKQADSSGGNAGEFTISNPYCPILYRPIVVVQTSGDDITIEETAQQALASELKNIKVIITTDRWEVDGKLIKPNNLITVTNKNLYLYKKTTLFIEEVTLTGDSEKTIAVLTCVLPEVYNKNYPKNVFIDAHKNVPI